MKLQDRLVNLELSKQLEKCGYKQEGLWWWCEDKIRSYDESTWRLYGKETAKARLHNSPELKQYVAPTVAELGEILPKTIRTKDDDYNLVIVKDLNKLQYEAEVDYSTWDTLKKVEADTEVNARAKMYIYLQKEGLI